MYDIITIGSSTIDVFADTDSELIKIKTTKGEEDLLAYPTGSKIIIKDLKFTTGGGGTNSAVSFSRFGLKVAYLGKVATDENGHKIIIIETSAKSAEVLAKMIQKKMEGRT